MAEIAHLIKTIKKKQKSCVRRKRHSYTHQLNKQWQDGVSCTKRSLDNHSFTDSTTKQTRDTLVTTITRRPSPPPHIPSPSPKPFPFFENEFENSSLFHYFKATRFWKNFKSVDFGTYFSLTVLWIWIRTLLTEKAWCLPF